MCCVRRVAAGSEPTTFALTTAEVSVIDVRKKAGDARFGVVCAENPIGQSPIRVLCQIKEFPMS